MRLSQNLCRAAWPSASPPQRSVHAVLSFFASRLLAILMLCVTTSTYAQDAQTTLPTQLRGVGIAQRLNNQVPLDLIFRDEAGQAVRFGDTLDTRPTILALVYYECPMLCTLVLNGLVRSLRALPFDIGEEFNVVTVSFDPAETPALAAAAKQDYVERYGRPGATSGWHFLTGDEPTLRALTQAIGFQYHYDTETRQYVHASGIVVLTPQGKIARYFFGIEYAPRDLRLALVEASANQIGSPIDQVLLFCYHYDPETGKYGLVIMNSLRLAGLATVLALGTFMLIMFRRDQKDRRESCHEVKSAETMSRPTGLIRPVSMRKRPQGD